MRRQSSIKWLASGEAFLERPTGTVPLMAPHNWPTAGIARFDPRSFENYITNSAIHLRMKSDKEAFHEYAARHLPPLGASL
jgi:hypothetical protein